jgi:hypothetical protein
MGKDTVQTAAITAFSTALLLGCDSGTAEVAVLDGIVACEDSSYWSLLIEAIRSALRIRTNFEQLPDSVQSLPTELRRLFELSSLSKDCFVLRILVGLSAEACTRLLKISATEFDDVLVAALKRVGFLAFHERTLSCEARASLN